MLELVKMALRVTTEDFDDELESLIESAKIDLGIAGVVDPDTSDHIIMTAIITYCKIHFGRPDNVDELKQSYDEQKAQLSTATGYTNWEAV